MAYRIPDKETLEVAIRRALAQSGGAGSLSALLQLVTEELQRQDPRYRVGPVRLRRVASQHNAVRTTIHTRRASSDEALRDACPVCGGVLKTVRNRTLTGETVALESRCTACPYWSGRHRRVPVRYAFHVREWSFA